MKLKTTERFIILRILNFYRIQLISEKQERFFSEISNLKILGLIIN